MKNTMATTVTIGITLALSCALHADELFKIATKRSDDRIDVKSEEDKTVFMFAVLLESAMQLSSEPQGGGRIRL